VVRVEPLGADVEVQPGETLIEAAWRQGLEWPTVCYAQAQCTLCHVRVLSGSGELGPMGEEEEQAIRTLLGRARRPDEIRLACRLEVHGDAVVRKHGVHQARQP
jgi:2Fe-2S ferredoxin